MEKGKGKGKRKADSPSPSRTTANPKRRSHPSRLLSHQATSASSSRSANRPPEPTTRRDSASIAIKQERMDDALEECINVTLSDQGEFSGRSEEDTHGLDVDVKPEKPLQEQIVELQEAVLTLCSDLTATRDELAERESQDAADQSTIRRLADEHGAMQRSIQELRQRLQDAERVARENTAQAICMQEHGAMQRSIREIQKRLRDGDPVTPENTLRAICAEEHGAMRNSIQEIQKRLQDSDPVSRDDTAQASCTEEHAAMHKSIRELQERIQCAEPVNQDDTAEMICAEEHTAMQESPVQRHQQHADAVSGEDPSLAQVGQTAGSNASTSISLAVWERIADSVPSGITKPPTADINVRDRRAQPEGRDSAQDPRPPAMDVHTIIPETSERPDDTTTELQRLRAEVDEKDRMMNRLLEISGMGSLLDTKAAVESGIPSKTILARVKDPQGDESTNWAYTTADLAGLLRQTLLGIRNLQVKAIWPYIDDFMVDLEFASGVATALIAQYTIRDFHDRVRTISGHAELLWPLRLTSAGFASSPEFQRHPLVVAMRTAAVMFAALYDVGDEVDVADGLDPTGPLRGPSWGGLRDVAPTLKPRTKRGPPADDRSESAAIKPPAAETPVASASNGRVKTRPCEIIITLEDGRKKTVKVKMSPKAIAFYYACNISTACCDLVAQWLDTLPENYGEHLGADKQLFDDIRGLTNRHRTQAPAPTGTRTQTAHRLPRCGRSVARHTPLRRR